MARTKYYNKQTQQWEYADLAVSVNGASAEAVLFTPQELLEEQQIQARENIGAIGNTLDRDLDMNGFKITNLPIPTSGSEPATKEFVENFTVEGSTYVATDDNNDGNIVLRPYVADEDELVFKAHIDNKENPHEVTAEQIGAVTFNEMNTAVSKAAPRNLLDNSDFRNPVNQRGNTTYNATEYSIDRWKSNMGSNLTVTVADGKIHLSKNNSGGTFGQYLPVNLLGKTVTAAICTSEGVFCRSLTVATSASLVQIGSLPAYFGANMDGDNLLVRIYFNDTSTVDLDLYWAALYEGEYTTETLPEYQPKGYGAELAECQRYYLPISYDPLGNGYTVGPGGRAYINIPMPVTMRTAPSIEYSTNDFYVRVNGVDYLAESISTGIRGNNFIFLSLINSSIPGKYPAAAYKLTPGLALNADL